MKPHYLLDGHTVVEAPDARTWMAWFEKADRTVARERVGEIEVWTQFNPYERPEGGLFVAQVYDGPMQGTARRFATWEEAEAGHRALCDEVRACNQKP